MGSYYQTDRPEGRYRGNDRRDDRRDDRRGGGGGRPRAEMHHAICDECGKSCEVPFRPSSNKPVYCSDCFEKKGGNSRSVSNDGRRTDSRDRANDAGQKLASEMKVLNDKLDRILELLEGDSKKKTFDSKDTKKAEKEVKPKKPVKTVEPVADLNVPEALEVVDQVTEEVIVPEEDSSEAVK